MLALGMWARAAECGAQFHLHRHVHSRGALAAHHALAIGMAATGVLPLMACAGVMIAAPLAAMTERFASANAATPAKLFKTKYFAVWWHVVGRRRLHQVDP